MNYQFLNNKKLQKKILDDSLNTKDLKNIALELMNKNSNIDDSIELELVSLFDCFKNFTKQYSLKHLNAMKLLKGGFSDKEHEIVIYISHLGKKNIFELKKENVLLDLIYVCNHELQHAVQSKNKAICKYDYVTIMSKFEELIFHNLKEKYFSGHNKFLIEIDARRVGIEKSKEFINYFSAKSLFKLRNMEIITDCLETNYDFKKFISIVDLYFKNNGKIEDPFFRIFYQSDGLKKDLKDVLIDDNFKKMDLKFQYEYIVKEIIDNNYMFSLEEPIFEKALLYYQSKLLEKIGKNNIFYSENIINQREYKELLDKDYLELSIIRKKLKKYEKEADHESLFRK